MLQLLLEDVSGEPFEAYMQRTVFQPLGMVHSTFHWLPAQGTTLATFLAFKPGRSCVRRYKNLWRRRWTTVLRDRAARRLPEAVHHVRDPSTSLPSPCQID